MDISLFKRIKEITTYTNAAFNTDIVPEEKRLKLNRVGHFHCRSYGRVQRRKKKPGILRTRGDRPSRMFNVSQAAVAFAKVYRDMIKYLAPEADES